MFDHIGIKVANVDPSVRFYTAALAPLGHVLCSRDDAGAGFGPAGEPALWLYGGPSSGQGTHLAFKARDRAWPRAAATMAPPAYAPIMAPRTTPRS
jgi:catechol 2,3-dioxygenase-like lactoylglutathione lyase family enzyme